MRLMINGQERELNALTLDKALDELGFRDAVVATALNGEFVSVDARLKTELNNNDRIEILAPMKGG